MPINDAELARIDLEIGRTRRSLARLGVVVSDAAAPRVGSRDSLRVAHLKERLILLLRERSRSAILSGDRGRSRRQARDSIH